MAPGVQIILIAALFASQIFVLSFFTPRRTRQFYTRLFTQYPPEEYPRLYPVPREKLQRRLQFVRSLHLLIGAVAAVTLVVSLRHGADAEELARRMFCCLIFQLVPLYLYMFWTIKAARVLRAMPPPSVRSAELRPWRVVDFVSPLWIGLGLGAQVIVLTCSVVAYLHRRQALPLVLFCSVVSGVLLVRMIYMLVGRAAIGRADPYMSTADTYRVRRRRFQLLFRAGAALGAFYAFALLSQAQLIRFNQAYFQAYTFVGLSIVMQLLGFALVSARGRELETRDFSVYRADGTPQAAP